MAAPGRVPRPRCPRASGTGEAAAAAAKPLSLIEKLRQKGSRPRPELPEAADGAPMSSALPPGSLAPPLRARVHDVLRERPELLETATGPSDFGYGPMGPADATDLADLQLEWFPEECYPDGAPWCARLLAHEGVVAVKATLAGDASGAVAGIAVALATRAAIEEFTVKSTVEQLRKELTVPRYIPWDAPGRRGLGYVLSIGVVGELRRRGVAAELLRRAMATMRTEAGDLRAVALDLAAYNTAAICCYEAAGFRRLSQTAEAYAGVGRRTHSSLLYVYFPGEAGA